MRQLVYKNVVGHNPRKREVSIEEISGRQKNSVSKKWICKYFVKEVYKSRSMEAIKLWIDKNKKTHPEHRCHILRNVDTRNGTNSIVCKVLGEFYVVKEKVAYKIKYINEIKVSMSN